MIGRATMAALWAEPPRVAGLTTEQRGNAKGERGIWLINALTGLASIPVSLTAYGKRAAMLCMSLPLTIGLFVWRHGWEGKAG